MEDTSSIGSSSEPVIDQGLIILSFVQSIETRKLSYRDLHHELHLAFSGHPRFQSGILMDTLERGVAHPVLHLKDVSDDPDFAEGDLGKPEVNNHHLFIRQGLYKEIHHIVPDGSLMESNQNKRNNGYIVLGFKRFEGSMIDNTWRDWSGARFIFLNLDDIYQATRISLYQRVKPNDIELFNYVLLVQCSNLTDDNIPALLDFVQRLRVKKVGAYVAAYEISG